MTNIFLKAKGSSLTASADGKITSGMVGTNVSIQYDEAWNSLFKTVFFKVGNFVRKREDVNTRTTVPFEVLRNHGFPLEIGIQGRDIDGKIVLPTVWATVGMIYNGAGGGVPVGGSPDIGESPRIPINDNLISSESTWSSQKIDEVNTKLTQKIEKLEAPHEVLASVLQIGEENKNKVTMQAATRDDDFGVVELTPFMEKPAPYQDKNRVILRNIAPGKEDNDAATVWQTKQIANSLIENTRTVVSEAEEKLREEMSEKRALHASTLRVGDTVLGDVLIQTGANEADSGGNLAGVLNLRPYAYQGNKVILRNIAPGTQENDAVTKGQMDRAFGDLESALDNIIAIQNGLLRFSFYVSAIEYFAEPGMTWREWMDSEYNDGSFSVGYIEDGDVAFEFVMIDETEVYWDGKLVPLDDRIIENGNYSV